MINLRSDHLDVVRSVLEGHIPNVEVRAFGSRVTGTAKDSSDLDLAVVGQVKIDRRILERLQLAFSESDLPFRVDVLDWNSVSPQFRRIIENKFEVIQHSGVGALPVRQTAA